MTKILHTEQVFAAIGPYVQGTDFDGMIMTSDQIRVNPQAGEVAENIAA